MSFSRLKKYTVFLCCLVLTAILSGKITGSQIMLDSRQYLSISDILRVSGTYSFDLNWLNGVEKAAEQDGLSDRRDAAGQFPPPEPTHFLEPAVTFVTALGMRLNPFFDPSWTFDELTEGEGARAVKTVNLLWAFLLLFGTGMLARETGQDGQE